MRAEKIKTLGREFYEIVNNRILYIDNNILMNENYVHMFEEFLEYKLKVMMPKVQYDELYNLKKKGTEGQKFKVRKAFKIIDKLQQDDKLIIENINIDSINKKAYADEVFISKIRNDLNNDKQVIFLTDDADLRIRVRALVLEKSEALSLYKYEDLLEMSKVVERDRDRIREEKHQIEKEQEEERLRNRSTSEKIIDNTIEVGKVVGIGVLAAVALFLVSSD